MRVTPKKTPEKLKEARVFNISFALDIFPLSAFQKLGDSLVLKVPVGFSQSPLPGAPGPTTASRPFPKGGKMTHSLSDGWEEESHVSKTINTMMCVTDT